MALDREDLERITRTLLEPLIARMEAGFTDLGARVDTGFRSLEVRIDQVVVNTGGHWRDHERRLLRIELALRANGHSEAEDDDEGEDT